MVGFSDMRRQGKGEEKKPTRRGGWAFAHGSLERVLGFLLADDLVDRRGVLHGVLDGQLGGLVVVLVDLLVVVGAVTPVPYSATCMLAGSVKYPFNTFLLICITRIIRFAFYGWMVWTFPAWFS